MERVDALYFARRNSIGTSLSTSLLACLLGVQLAEARVELQPCKNNVAPQQQIELGQKVVQQVYQQMPVLPDSSPVTRYVQGLGQKLTAQAPGYKWPFNFHVVNVADVNAFALPGGSIFVNLGTIQAATNEAQLAAVMAHETSHVVLQHSICNLEKQQRVGMIAGLGQLAAGVLLGNTAAGTLAQESIGLGAGLGFLKMSRGAEQQADLMGVGILYDAGYDPRAMPQFFETIQQKYGTGGAQFLSDHPNPGNRTEYVSQEISGFVQKPRYVTNTPEFDRVHGIVAGMRAYTSKEVASGVWKRQTPNQTVSTGVNQYNQQSGANPVVDTRAPRNWVTFQGNGFSMEVPDGWQALGNRNSAMLAPSGGIGQSSNGQAGNLIYGVLTDVYRPQQPVGQGQAFSALLDELAHDNPGLRPGRPSSLNVDGTNAQNAHAVDQSANNGRGEHDWIIGVPVADSLRYFVFVASEPDFNAMRPTFEHILNSIRLQ
jgi:hypothetical protein